MLYKEALQSHTLEEQAKQLEELNDQLAEAQQAKKERVEALEAQKAMEEQLQVHRSVRISASLQVGWAQVDEKGGQTKAHRDRHDEDVGGSNGGEPAYGSQRLVLSTDSARAG